MLDDASPSSGADSNALSVEFLSTLDRRAATAITELSRAVKSHQESHSHRTHGALVLAVAAAQRVEKLLGTVNEQQQQHQRAGHSAVVPLSLLVQLKSHRAAIRRALPTAVAAAETSGSDGTADAVSALRSLMHTRSLLGIELRKVQGAVDEIAGSSASLDLLQTSLQDVNATVEMAQRLVRKLLVVKSTDDIVLRISAAVYILVVVYIMAQRVFGFFPTKIG
ncbi:hypothetical protein DQ04_00881040 [Trypanosoma grayi]|uniref:hypothetical protein n=1 Tax=Trypanosoma grayi TaxID=71804 RepID=UPI0004F41E8A|nr:hypothetical protein DQ04_00881040 [Trypanosoma grayi]KEG13636.1 hypothetical protein DQ04_00881040 [Trypanosoma grayi]